MKNNRKVLIAVAVLAALILLIGGVFFATRPQTAQGAKGIVVDVVLADGSTKTHELHTDEEYLRGALEAEGMVEGSESEYGLFVTSVDGVAADDAKQEWWCFTKDGETLMTGVDTTPIADGDHFEITLTVGY